MKRKLFSLALVAVLTMSTFTACGENNAVTESVNNDIDEIVSTIVSTDVPINTPSVETHEHQYVETVTMQSTCTEKGLKTFSCECGDVYTEEIELIEHISILADNGVKETCDKDGKAADTICEVCNTVIIEGEVIPATGHIWGSYTYNNDATYEADGTETATCTVCGNTTARTKSGTKLVKQEEPKQPDNPGSGNTVEYYYNEDGRIMSNWTKGDDGIYYSTGDSLDLSAWYGHTIAEYEAANGYSIGFGLPDGSAMIYWPGAWQDYVIGTCAVVDVRFSGNNYTCKVKFPI